MFNQGDLVHIPQGVTMIRQLGGNLRYVTTTKPEIGVFLKYLADCCGDAQIAMVDGHVWHVEHKKLRFKESHVN